MNMPSIVLGAESIADDAYFKDTVAKVVDTREWFAGEIKKLGFTSLPSSANFIFMTHENIPAKQIFEKAKAAGIYVRYFNKPKIDNFLRVTIGTREEMETFLKFLSEVM
jgi:histidinol-phosphate aminotransferase